MWGCKQGGGQCHLGTVIVQAGKGVVHELEAFAGSVRQNEAGPHDGDLCMLNLQGK